MIPTDIVGRILDCLTNFMFKLCWVRLSLLKL